MIDRETRDLFTGDTKNPLFEYERRKISWIKDDTSVSDFRNTARMVAIVGTLAAWLIVSIATGNDSSVQDGLLIFVIYAAFIATLAADLYLVFTVSINLYRQTSPANWDLMRTSPQSEKNIFDALYAIAQVNASRPIAIEAALRVVIIELVLLRPLLPSSRGGTLSLDFIFSPLFCVLLAVFGTLVALCILEVRWRTGTFIAFCFIAVSHIKKNSASPYLALLGGILSVDLLQIASFIGLRFFIASVISPMVIGISDFAFLIVPIGAIVWGGVAYLMYKIIGDLCLHVAFNRMFAPTD